MLNVISLAAFDSEVPNTEYRFRTPCRCSERMYIELYMHEKRKMDLRKDTLMHKPCTAQPVWRWAERKRGDGPRAADKDSGLD